jgi:hypothetical protein
MDNTQKSCRIMLEILHRASGKGLNFACYKTLLAIKAIKGRAQASDISEITGMSFNWPVCKPLHDMRLVIRKQSETAAYDYEVTPQGDKILQYILNGKVN